MLSQLDGVCAGIVAHQQVVHAVNAVAQVTLDNQASNGVQSQDSIVGRAAIEAEVGRSISMLLAATKTARGVAAARISQVLEASGKRGMILAHSLRGR